VAPHHLEVDARAVVDSALAQAAHELNRMNNYKVRAVLICLSGVVC